MNSVGVRYHTAFHPLHCESAGLRIRKKMSGLGLREGSGPRDIVNYS